ncbi:11085_t:CDS:2 [Paraglomus brasilianum]|uniref:11085_t:CDS:1 n=1 Tax=Paraglomus brasilianum TaxID=144538 RepID=A0A9N9CF72_9GLOM|nr:11085_t:CDS:2 [Paraglomus brasilianum]
MGAKTKRNILDKTACVFVLKSAKREVAIVGYTCDLKQNKPRKNPRPRSRKHNAGTWIPVMAVTGFKTQKDAMSFEWFVKKVVKQKEYNDYVKLYRGRCPATVIKRILAIRGLLCEQDKWWSSKRQRYCCHWFGKSFGDEMQFRKMQFNWGRTGRPVEHIDMELDGIEELFGKCMEEARDHKCQVGSD